jgi:hypothetical protein
MRVVYVHGDDPHDVSGTCLLPPPEPECCPDICEPEPICQKPVTRAKDAVRISPHEFGRTFNLYGYGCKPIPIHISSADMVIRKRGQAGHMSRECAVSVSIEGGAVFRWSHHFKGLEPGYYEGDIMVNHYHVITVGLYIAPFNGTAVSTEVEHPPCSTSDPCDLEVDQTKQPIGCGTC